MLKERFDAGKFMDELRRVKNCSDVCQIDLLDAGYFIHDSLEKMLHKHGTTPLFQPGDIFWFKPKEILVLMEGVITD